MSYRKTFQTKKVNVGYHPDFLQWKWLAIKAKKVKAITQPPTFTKPPATIAIPTQQFMASVTITQPATISAAPAQSKETSSD